MSFPGPSFEARAPQGSFAQAIAVALGAGLASALLFALSAQGALLPSLLAAIAPMPLMAAALGFSHWTGLLAGLIGGLGLSLTSTGLQAVLYFGALAAPSWHLARLALDVRTGPDGAPRWRPLSELALWGVAIGVMVSVGWVMIVARSAGGDFDAALDAMAKKLAPALDQFVASGDMPPGVTMHNVAVAMLRALPVAAAGSTVTMMLGNLWLAGRVTRLSGLLARPWPNVAREFGLPRIGLALLAGGMTLAFLDGFGGQIGWILTAATFMGFALQGLAAAHVLTLGWPQRRTALFALYVTLVVVPVAPAFVGLFGVADSLFGLRARKSPPSSI